MNGVAIKKDMKKKKFLWGKRPWLRVANGLRKYRTWPEVIQTYRNWPLWFLDLFGLLRSGEATYILRNGVRFKMRPNTLDQSVLDQIWIRNVYLADPTRIPETALVVDIGANIGGFSVFAARLARHGEVLCYEPHPENFRILQRNLQINHLHNVVALQMGVAGTAGQYDLSGDGASASMMYGHSMGEFIQIQCITLIDIFRQHSLDRVHFLKCDCEGAEYDIFLNISKAWLQRIDHIAMEFHAPTVSSRSYRDLVAYFESAGFQVHIAGSELKGMLYGENLEAAPRFKLGFDQCV